jgi:hypothetical protein
MNPKTLNEKSTAKANNEYFIRYQFRDESDGVVVKAKTACGAVKMAQEEICKCGEHFRLLDIKNLSITKIECQNNSK